MSARDAWMLDTATAFDSDGFVLLVPGFTWQSGNTTVASVDSSGVVTGPTNNLAEQAIRFVVIDRQITQGTRSEKGRRWCERIWTAIATCAQQGRAVFHFLLDSVQAHLSGAAPPSLLPSGP
jgi:hypothetical protein